MRHRSTLVGAIAAAGLLASAAAAAEANAITNFASLDPGKCGLFVSSGHTAGDDFGTVSPQISHPAARFCLVYSAPNGELDIVRADGGSLGTNFVAAFWMQDARPHVNVDWAALESR